MKHSCFFSFSSSDIILNRAARDRFATRFEGADLLKRMAPSFVFRTTGGSQYTSSVLVGRHISSKSQMSRV